MTAKDNRFTPEELERFLKDKAERDAAAEQFFAKARALSAENKPMPLVRRRGWNVKK